MRIISPGSKPEQVKRFLCTDCKCLFEANYSECHLSIYDFEATMTCPCCSKLINWEMGYTE